MIHKKIKGKKREPQATKWNMTMELKAPSYILPTIVYQT